MRDFTLRFSDKADFRAFLRKLNWEEDEELQNAVLVDEIGFTFRETDVSDDGEPEYTRNEGYFVNIRLLDDGFDDSVFREWVGYTRAPAQGVVLRIADGYHVDTSCALCRGGAGTGWSFYRKLGLRGDSRLYVLHCA